MFQGKMKAVTFSYDDGVIQDKRLIKLFDHYGLRCTFNINSGLLGQTDELIREGRSIDHTKVKPEEIADLYRNHEVAVHTLTHPDLTTLNNEEIIRQVEWDRIALSKLCGYAVIGMAYPFAAYNERIERLIRQCTGVKYARTACATNNFDLQSNLYEFNPTSRHHGQFDDLFELAEEFIKLECAEPKIFYIWGHSYELDIHDDWTKMEQFCNLISGRDDIFYGTNTEVLLA